MSRSGRNPTWSTSGRYPCLIIIVGIVTSLSVDLSGLEGNPVLGIMILFFGLQLPLPVIAIYFRRRIRRAIDFLVAAMVAGIEQEMGPAR